MNEIEEVVIEGYKYLSYGGMLVPVLDENGDHEKEDDIIH